MDKSLPVSDETLPSLIEGEIARSIGYSDGSLASARAQELDYYFGKPLGNEEEGSSQIVSTDVADTVEGILPIILNIFTSSDDAVRFDPNGPEDEDAAAQQTEVANYVFYRQNNGFLVLYEWFKDALIQKNGIVKYWWEEKNSTTTETYKGLTEGEYRGLADDKSIIQAEEIEHTQYPDPAALQAREMMRQKILTAPPEMQPQLSMALEAQPIPQLHDVSIRVTKDISQICIEAIPPEEFGISAQHNSVSIQQTPFCYHRTRKSTSQLREMGVPDEIIEKAGSAPAQDESQEAMARDRYLSDTWRSQNGTNETDRDIWVTEAFYRVDYDGDGISELRRIMLVGREVWLNDETDHINFAALTPVIMPHRWIGRSVAELVMDIQFTKSVLWRQMLNNLYLTNNPQKAVLASAGGMVQANLDDLLTSRPGGILREYVPGAIRHIETPFVAGASFPMMEYIDAVKENRTGVTRYNQGTDSDSLNKTARGIQMIQTAGAQRTNLIARIFAETGVKDLFRGIVYMLSKYSHKAMTLKLRNKWVDVDPREWKTQYNMTINVGLGTGNRDIQLQHLALVHQQQIELMKEGRGYMVSDDNIYNLYKKSSEAMGFKHPELFVTDPRNVPDEAKKKPPDPAIVKTQMDAQAEQAKLQFSSQKEQLNAQTEQAIAQITAQSQLAIAQMNNASAEKIAQMKIAADAQLAVFDKQNEVDSSGSEMNLKAQTAMAGIETERAIAAEKMKLEREKAEAQHQLDVFKAQQAAAAERSKAAVTAAVEKMKAAIAARTTMQANTMKQKSADKGAKSAAKPNGGSEPSIVINNIIPKSGNKSITTPSGDKYSVSEE